MQQSNSVLKDILTNYEKRPDVACSMIPSVTSKRNRLQVPKPQSSTIRRRGPKVVHDFEEI